MDRINCRMSSLIRLYFCIQCIQCNLCSSSCIVSVVLDTKAKVASAPFLKCPTQFPLILWHPYARHYYFCVMTEKEQKKWHAVFQDCVRHTNNGESLSQTMTKTHI